jgi:hypothetical protein
VIAMACQFSVVTIQTFNIFIYLSGQMYFHPYELSLIIMWIIVQIFYIYLYVIVCSLTSKSVSICCYVFYFEIEIGCNVRYIKWAYYNNLKLNDDLEKLTEKLTGRAKGPDNSHKPIKSVATFRNFLLPLQAKFFFCDRLK